MPSNWFKTTIGAQATLQRGIDITRAEQRAGNVPVVSSSGISSYHDTSAVSGPGVVLGRKGVVGSVYFIEKDFWPHDTTLWVKDFHGNDPRFVYYYFKSIASRLAALDVGSANPTLNRNHVHPLMTMWPTLATQKSIAATLSILDDRIDLLRQTNATLESIAQGLFKSWFIDFDPVRAKAEGREPKGVDVETAALFPGGYEESALGPIPNGWRSEKLGDICELTKGCSYKGDGLSDAEGAYMFNLGCFNAHRVFATERVKRYTGEYRPRHCVFPGDLIMANTDMTQARDILGRPAFVPDGYEPGFVSHHVFKVSPKAADIALANAVRVYLFFTLKRPEFRERAIGFATGTTVLALPPAAVIDCPACIPSDSVLLAFSRMVHPFLAQLRENERLAGQLVDLRDTLLPRLISGKLRVPEAEAQVSEALA